MEVTFDCEGPMGFTLGDMAAMATAEKGKKQHSPRHASKPRHGASVVRSRKAEDGRGTAEKENNGRGGGGEDEHEDEKEGEDEDVVQDDDDDDDDDEEEQEQEEEGGEEEWAASVVGFVKSRGLCEAQRLGLRHGDVLRKVNGYDMRGVRFKELCTFLGRSDFPRTLCFHRPGPSK